MKRKIWSALLAFVIAFGLWLYVITYVSPGSEETYYNIPVIFEGETALSERNLMITSGDTEDFGKPFRAEQNQRIQY